MKEGGMEITGPSLEGKHLVIVFRDNSPNSQSTDIMAEDGFCNDQDNGYFPFDSLTFSVQEGDVLDYDIIIDGTEYPIPLFDIKNDDDSNFTVKNGDHLTVEFLEIPTWDNQQDADTTAPTDSKSKVVQEEEEDEPVQPGNPLETFVKLVNGDQVVSETRGFGWVVPIELVDLALTDPAKYHEMFTGGPNENPSAGTAQNGDSNSTDDGFNPFANIIRTTESTLTVGGDFMDEDNATVTMEITIDSKTGIAVLMDMKRTQEGSPDMTLTIELTSDLTEFKERLDNPEDDGNQTITTSPGFESLLLIAGLIGLVLLKKK
jgi:hypothetical protein